jgi:hypothetical protein
MIIGVVGFIGCGKGTVGDLLEQRGFVKDSFATPLKDACSAMFGWPRDLLEGDNEASRQWREQPDPFWSEKMGKQFTPRLALQLLGTEAGRDVFHKDIWVNSLLKRAGDKDVVITDVRFKNELKFIQKNNGIVVRVKRGPEPDWYEDAIVVNKGDRFIGWALAKDRLKRKHIHQSETDWVGAKFDYVIENNGTLEDLGKQVDGLLQFIKK